MSVRIIRDKQTAGFRYLPDVEVGTFFVTRDGDWEDELVFLRTRAGAIAMGENHERGDAGWDKVYPVDVEIVVKD